MTVDLYQTPLRYGAAYDELSADGVTPRPHWAHLMESLLSIGHAELERRWSRAERRIRENGITYNIYSDPLGANRLENRYHSAADPGGRMALYRGGYHPTRPVVEPAS